MSERTYAPRSGGRTAEPRITEPRRRPSTGTEGDVRGARRQPAPGAREARTRETGRVDAGRDGRAGRDRAVRETGRAGAGRDAGTRETARIAAGRGTAVRETGRGTTVRETGRGTAVREAGRGTAVREAGRVTAVRETGRIAAGRDRGAGPDGGTRTAAARRTGTLGVAGRTGARRDEAVRGGRTAPVQGTAALQLDTAVAEPLRMTDTAAAPRLRVAPPVPISAPRAPFIAGVIALVIVGVIGILLINTKTNENSFEISRLQDQQTALDTQQQQLENQLAVYESAGNLDAAAKRLGLVKAEAPAYIRLPDGKVIGVPKPGTGRPAVTAQDAADAAGTARQGTQGTTQQGTTQQGTTGQQATAPQGATQQGATQQGGAQPVTPGAGE